MYIQYEIRFMCVCSVINIMIIIMVFLKTPYSCEEYKEVPILWKEKVSKHWSSKLKINNFFQRPTRPSFLFSSALSSKYGFLWRKKLETFSAV